MNVVAVLGLLLVLAYPRRVYSDKCLPNPCVNGGICSVAPSGDRVCECLPDFSGQLCEYRMKCRSRDGWFYGGVNTCYKIMTSPETYSDAQKLCRKEGARLAIIPTLKDSQAISEKLNKSDSDHQVAFFGLNDIKKEGIYTYKDNEFTHWYRGRPNNYKNGNVGTVMYPNGDWDARSMDRIMHFICQCQDKKKCSGWPRYCNKFLMPVRNATTYMNAQQHCVDIDGEGLAIVENQEENQFIRSLTNSNSTLWIGYNCKRAEDDGLFQWNALFTNWGPKEPSDGGFYGKDCSGVKRYGGWETLNCHREPYPFICSMPAYIHEIDRYIGCYVDKPKKKVPSYASRIIKKKKVPTATLR